MITIKLQNGSCSVKVNQVYINQRDYKTCQIYGDFIMLGEYYSRDYAQGIVSKIRGLMCLENWTYSMPKIDKEIALNWEESRGYKMEVQNNAQ